VLGLIAHHVGAALLQHTDIDIAAGAKIVENTGFDRLANQRNSLLLLTMKNNTPTMRSQYMRKNKHQHHKPSCLPCSHARKQPWQQASPSPWW
jgi:hypothetical protein